jgi:hypothetical protein
LGTEWARREPPHRAKIGRVIVATAPNWAEILGAIASAVAGLGVLIAVVQLGSIKRDRHLGWIFEISRRWNEDKIEESRLALSKYDSDIVASKIERWRNGKAPDEHEMLVLSRLPDFFEDVALMVKRGRLNVGFVWQALSGPVEKWWAFWEESVVVFRQKGDPEAYTQFQWLARRFKKYEARRRKRKRLRAWLKRPRF